jgi:ribosomal protein S8
MVKPNRFGRIFLFKNIFKGYIGEFEVVDDHRSGKIVVNLNGRLNKVIIKKKTKLF